MLDAVQSFLVLIQQVPQFGIDYACVRAFHYLPMFELRKVANFEVSNNIPCYLSMTYCHSYFVATIFSLFPWSYGYF